MSRAVSGAGGKYAGLRAVAGRIIEHFIRRGMIRAESRAANHLRSIFAAPPEALRVNRIARRVYFNRSTLARHPWPYAGPPATVHADNAKEFRGHTLGRACAEYGITLTWRLVATPHYGVHIERLLGTVVRGIHALPGMTFSTVRDRGDYDAEGKAVFTLEELELYLSTFLLSQRRRARLTRPKGHVELWTTMMSVSRRGTARRDCAEMIPLEVVARGA